MIRLNAIDLRWFDREVKPRIECQSGSPAADIYPRKGIHGIALLHEAIKRRDVKRIQFLLDN